MSKTERIFPLNTFGGRIQNRRKNILKISRPEFYDLIYPGVNISDASWKGAGSICLHSGGEGEQPGGYPFI